MKNDLTLFDATANRDTVYRQVQDTLPASRAKVLIALLELGTATDQQIKEKLRTEINLITGRRRELCQLGLVENVGEEKGPYRFPRTVWKVNMMQLNYFITQSATNTRIKKRREIKYGKHQATNKRETWNTSNF